MLHHIVNTPRPLATRKALASTLVACAFVAPLVGCSPRVGVELPDKPIEININAKIDHEIRIKVERDVSQVVRANNELF